ncbi:MAG: hypothetical protein HQK64_10680, partial [Desulfamplus sp.]|nr:hypothetical protein [Desulfamplus sp.]
MPVSTSTTTATPSRSTHTCWFAAALLITADDADLREPPLPGIRGVSLEM